MSYIFKSELDMQISMHTLIICFSLLSPSFAAGGLEILLRLVDCGDAKQPGRRASSCTTRHYVEWSATVSHGQWNLVICYASKSHRNPVLQPYNSFCSSIFS
ncbi:V-type proton ATPase proteolipid subunit [Plakobranchus ocellatus]|uniref:V-type proton ATPase proteolipid subunit n=1 Tax=Plakobranchus ocellatus TaxID=259542 RepID=A0AAV3Y3F8_9GAST|nr:V-type proton ATPase proteolipid subunit [Plakobranchus ocellatus]